jgi:predicted outer membrane repeat protein
MWLTAADGAQHQGLAGAGVVLDGASRTRYGILVADDYTRIEGLELKGFRRNFLAAAITVWKARGVVLERLLIHDFEWPRFEGAGIEGAMHSEFTARSCIIYDGGAAGIMTRWPHSSARVENCTIYGMRGVGIDESHGRVSVVNTISMGNGKGDFRIRRGAQTHTISSDRTAAGEGSLVFLKPADQFVSVTPGSEDFHLREGSAAVDAGKNLALEAISMKASPLWPSGRPHSAHAAADIDGQDRMGEADWDIGADEVEAALEGVWFVDGAQAGDGTSWARAFGTIQQAVAAARPGEQIWVREGTYDVAAEIVIDTPLALYGGFSGSERRLDQRDSRQRPTVLDGRGENRCFTLAAGGILIDGFIISNTDGGNGGAVLAQNVTGFTIRHCRFEDNTAANGGALYARNSSGVLSSCTFSGNLAKTSGGAIYTQSSALMLANCIFTDNSAGASGIKSSGGGAIYAGGNGAVITNCIFFNNWTANEANPGGAIFNFLADTRLSNSILWGNTAAAGPQLSDYLLILGRTEHCNIDQAGFDGIDGNIRREPLWVNPALGDFRLQADSPCIDAGREDAPGLPEVDFDGRPRVSGATVDIGPFEFGED